MEGGGLGFGVCPSVQAPTDPEQKPAVTAGKGKGKNPNFSGIGHLELTNAGSARAGGTGEPLGREANHQNQEKNPYSLGRIKSTDELAAGEQSRSFWLLWRG